MSLFKVVGVLIITLIQRGMSQTLSSQVLDDLLSGTLTITIAPDPTCGHYNGGANSYACGSRSCTWESGLINRVFCDWDAIHTTCLDQEDECGDECLIHKHNRRCVDSLLPICALAYFGDGIYGHYCGSTKTGISVDTTRSREPRDLVTMIVVNRTPVSLVVDDSEDSESTSKSASESDPDSTANSLPDTIAETETTVTEATQSVSATTSPPDGPHDDVNVGAIVGGVVGGLAVVGLALGFLGFLFLRRQRRPENTPSNIQVHNDQQQPYTTEAKDTPFDRLRQLVGGSDTPVELQGDAVSPTTARTHEMSGMGS